jgi:hypothetical protein
MFRSHCHERSVHDVGMGGNPRLHIPGEYTRFVQYIEGQVMSGAAKELSADPPYGKGMIYGGRWFRDVETGAVWRLVAPDPPFRGLWEPVVPNARG